MGLRVTNDNVIIRELEMQTETPGGLIITSTDDGLIAKGLVICSQNKSDFELNIFFNRSDALPFIYDGEDLLILKQEHIIAYVDKEG